MTRSCEMDWPYTDVDKLYGELHSMENAISGMDVLRTLEAVRDANSCLAAIATRILEIAADETNITAKRLAMALDVPPSTLRGLRKR
jgi:hypothetical protein